MFRHDFLYKIRKDISTSIGTDNREADLVIILERYGVSY